MLTKAHKDLFYHALRLTAIYDLVPTKEFAIESISCPLTPKSHNLISPLELTSMFEGFTSVKRFKKK